MDSHILYIEYISMDKFNYSKIFLDKIVVRYGFSDAISKVHVH